MSQTAYERLRYRLRAGFADKKGGKNQEAWKSPAPRRPGENPEGWESPVGENQEGWKSPLGENLEGWESPWRKATVLEIAS